MEALRSQELIWKLMFSFVDSITLKCAIELGIADIIHSRGEPMSLSQIALAIQSNSNLPTSPDMPYLSRIIRFLARKNVFTEHHNDGKLTPSYGPSESSRWLLRDSKSSLVSMALLHSHRHMTDIWHCLADCAKDGGIGFEKAKGCNVWEFALANPEFNILINNAMAGIVSMFMREMLLAYKDDFGCINGTMVDVGGGTGATLSEIVKSHPHIKGINYDLPHVIAMAPEWDGVTHVGGDLFESIPNGDVIILKLVLHCFDDEKCGQVLRNCRKALKDENIGKIIIVDIVLEPNRNEMFDDLRMVYDLMMPLSNGGKERTELEWKKLLNQAGFPHYKITKIPSIHSIIEAFLE